MRSVQDGLDTRADTKNFFDGQAEIRSRPFKGPDPARLLNSVKIASVHTNYLLLPQLCVGLEFIRHRLYPFCLLTYISSFYKRARTDMILPCALLSYMPLIYTVKHASY